MANIIDRMADSLSHMSRRERILVLGLGCTLVVLVLAIFTYLIMDGLDSRRQENARIESVLKRLQRNRSRLVASKSVDARLDVKLDRKPPALQGHIETLAKRFEVEVNDYKPSKPKALGKKKRVLEKAVTISLYDIGLDKLMKFINAIESGGYLIMITQLQVVPRSTNHARLDVKKLKVSSYERNKEEKKVSSKKKKKGRTRRKGK